MIQYLRFFNLPNFMQPIRKIIHIDMYAFYASVEQKDRPEFKGKPCIVGCDPQSRGVLLLVRMKSESLVFTLPCRQ